MFKDSPRSEYHAPALPICEQHNVFLGGLGFIDYVTQPKDWDENFENQIATVREIRKVRRHTGLVTPDEFIERSFHVLPIYQCKEIFHGISVFELCAKTKTKIFDCNVQAGSPLGKWYISRKWF